MRRTAAAKAGVHDVLRAATAAPHARLEAELDIFSHTGSPDGRRHLARRFHGLHAGAEAALGPWLQAIPGLDYSDRRRSSLIAHDLADLGDAILPPACPAPDLASAGEALGLLYVLEGSTLGGRVIRKRLLSDGQDLTGLAFLDPYGARVGERWTSFLAVLTRDCAGRPESAVTGALTGFALAHRWLCAPEGAS